MDPIYAETINLFANDLQNLWRDKNAFSSVKSKEGVSIEDGNLCTFNRFMLSARRSDVDDVSMCSRNSNIGKQGWGSTTSSSMTLIERLAKTASIWTLPDITRIQTDKILHDFQPGIFIVRMTTDKKTMVLSYKMEDRAQHVMIKVDVIKGFFMDGSQHVFRNVNHLIAHYMKHPIQNPDLRLKLPRALMEANETLHFQFFENMKLNFWTTMLANKSIDDIWSKPVHDPKTKSNSMDEVISEGPAVPPRDYHPNELNILQGLADISDDADAYQEILKISRNRKNLVPLPELPPSPPSAHPLAPPLASLPNPELTVEEKEIYSHLWQCKTDENVLMRINDRNLDSIQSLNDPASIQSLFVDNSSLSRPDPFSSHGSINDDDKIRGSRYVKTPPSFKSVLANIEFHKNREKSEERNQDNSRKFTIVKIIENHYPQLINRNVELGDKSLSLQSLQEEILGKNQDFQKKEPVEPTPYYQVPWDLKTPLISKVMDLNNATNGSDGNRLNEHSRPNSTEEKHFPDKYGSLPLKLKCQFEGNSSVNEMESIDTKPLIDSIESDADEDLTEDENRLQIEFLGEIESFMYSPSPNTQIYSSEKFKYGQLIRDFLTRLCSGDGSSEIALSVRLFIKCTRERNDLNPYTTMRLIKQYMSGLKNRITKNKQEFSLNVIIKEEISHTPKNVFINLDSIIESVLTKCVVKPLSVHVRRLLVLEHYKNNNLNLIANGVERCQSIDAEKLGLKPNAKSIIDSKIDSIRQRFLLISKQYSPEKKIKYMISIVDIVFNMLSLIFPETNIDSMQVDIKTDNILPLFVYIFSQCKLDALATQCEVEYVEGLIWSSKLVNGEPGFFLLNLMSALEAVKVLARPNLNSVGMINLAGHDTVNISNSSFFTKLNPSSISDAAIGSVNVIILDEKINRLVTKTFPVRSTVTVSSLCNTVAHRLGIFNPKEYNLYKYNGFDESLLSDHECPLVIKQSFQQQTGETMNFLFKRKNANFILPCDISTQRQ